MLVHDSVSMLLCLNRCLHTTTLRLHLNFSAVPPSLACCDQPFGDFLDFIMDCQVLFKFTAVQSSATPFSVEIPHFAVYTPSTLSGVKQSVTAKHVPRLLTSYHSPSRPRLRILLPLSVSTPIPLLVILMIEEGQCDHHGG
jgi:hypothetical protein